MTTERKTDAALWDALAELPGDLLQEDTPISLADAVIRDAGGDPAEVGKRGAALVAKLARKRRLSWQDRARQRRAALVGDGSRVLRLDLEGDALRAAVASARAALGPGLGAAWRAHNDADLTEDEQRELLADLELLVLQKAGERGQDP